MSGRASCDVLVVGNYCHDVLPSGEGGAVHTLGGSAAYISSVFDAAGVDHAVVAVAGEDFAYADRVRYPPRIIPGTRTTRFLADFSQAERVLRVDARSVSIPPEDIVFDARVALACGVMGEVPPETLVRMSQRAQHVLADAQGLLRTLDDEGRVWNQRLEDTPYAELLGHLRVLKASEEEARALDLDAVRARTCVVITRGRKGSTVLTARHSVHLPSWPVEEVDPTGAGDCFLAGFTLGLLRGWTLAKCAELANWFGAQAVTQVGVPRVDVSTLPDILR
ncbi:PfkB family carbohydrate kinase [Myxococcus sp. K38C18041901]|uniref:PfkB family carbohydrate kinase n=1 Tax=Myxococcus guangdongensis TaxID=2906760 RepID=UPI0020A70894|nr:PfkB family carbohydrate kinase [Myxococcus guangdongensis]MCP3058929.1 PfkB family carbohydrate kinase [Myxococcus guangdongensis]